MQAKKPSVTRISQLSVQMLLWIGFFQMLALIPGTSRSGATIVGALLIGVSREVAAEFTFFLAIPAMFGASLLKLIKFGFHFTGAEFWSSDAWMYRVFWIIGYCDQVPYGIYQTA